MGRTSDDQEGRRSDPEAPVDLRAAPSPPAPNQPGQPGSALVVGVDDWAIRDATARMQAAGWTVHHCSDSVDAPVPCNAMIPSRGCPLNRHRVDLVLDVRTRPVTELLLSEMGSVCGLRDGRPLVLAGPAEGTSLAPWARLVPVGGDLVAACAQVVEDTARAMRDAGTAAPTTEAPPELEGAT